jgi:hypothetical protein
MAQAGKRLTILRIIALLSVTALAGPLLASPLIDAASPDEPDVSSEVTTFEMPVKGDPFPTVFEELLPGSGDQPSSRPEHMLPSGAVFYGFRTQDDYPDNGIVLNSGEAVPRDFAGYGLKVLNLRGGGCFPVAPDAFFTCLKEQDANGNIYTVMKKRERWTVRYTYTAPGPGVETLLEDKTVSWVTLSNGVTCMSPYLYGCTLSGQSMNDLAYWTSGRSNSCAMRLGPGYKVQLYYQYSRYRGDETIPPSEPVWVPETVPATSTTLAKPGMLVPVFENEAGAGSLDWRLDPGEKALRAHFDPPRINPAVPERWPDKGDKTVTNVGGVKNTQIDAGKSKLIVEASECGTPYANVHVTGTAEFVDDSGGHTHSVAGAVNTPPGSKVVTFPAIKGDTDANGRLEIDGIIAGEFAGQYDVQVETTNLRVPGLTAWPAKARPARLTVGFRNLVPLANVCSIPRLGGLICSMIVPVGYNNQSGCGSGLCDNHRNVSLYGHPKLLMFIAKMAALYRKETKNSDAVLPINDMSLPLGGGFDIAGNWQVWKDVPNPAGGKFPFDGHITHRHGIDVDVNRWVKINGVEISVNEEKLDLVVQVLKGKKITEPTIHYRIPKSEIDSVVGDVK